MAAEKAAQEAAGPFIILPCYPALLYPTLPCPVLPCPALSCPALLCYAMLCYAMLCPALLCFALPCPALLCFALPCPALLLRTLLCPALPPTLPYPYLRTQSNILHRSAEEKRAEGPQDDGRWRWCREWVTSRECGFESSR